MKWSLVAAAVVVLATSCAAPERPDEWTVAREAPGPGVDDPDAAVCDDIRALALGSRAGDPTIDPTLGELARIGAIVGAADALPALNRSIDTLTTGGGHGDVHDDLVVARESIDPASHDACGVPVFSATYAATGWPSCHGELVIPVAGYTPLPDGCGAQPLPAALPCFTGAEPFLPIDCNTGEVVQLVAGEWEAAGEPREVVGPERAEPSTTTTTTTVVPLVEALDAPGCTDLFALFTGADPLTGGVEDLDRLALSVQSLGDEVEQLVDGFVAANREPPDLADFEALVLALDLATAARCGLPLVSALDALAGGVAELPCWLATGAAYPAHVVRECG